MEKKGKIQVGDIVVIRHFHPKASHHGDPGIEFNKARYKVEEVDRSIYFDEIPKFYIYAVLIPLPEVYNQAMVVSNAVCIVRAKDTKNDSQS